MPLYEARCRACGSVHEYVRPIARCMETPICCAAPTEKVILSAPFGQVDIPAYESPITGEWIEGRAARRNDLAKHGCRPWEGMEQEQKVAAEARKRIDAEIDKQIETAAVDAWQALKPEQRRSLESAA